MTPEELCNAYRAELARLYGKERARKSKVSYGRGWYYIDVAQHFADGSIGTIGPTPAYRKRQILEMLEGLRGREPRAEA